MRQLLLCLCCLATVLAGEPYADPPTGYAWPAQLTPQLRYIGHHVYEQKGLGYSVRYEDPADGGIKIDIYLYDENRKDIGDGVASQAAQALHRRFGEELQMVVKAGRYAAAERDDALTRQLAVIDPKVLLASGYLISYLPQEDGSPGPTMKSILLLTAIDGRLFKVRCSYGPAYPLDLAALSTGLGTVMRGLRPQRPQP